MKILLIGATGQIGYALTQALSKTDQAVSVLVRDKRKLRFPESIKVIESKKFDSTVFKATLMDRDHVIYGVGLPEQFLFERTQFERINFGLLKIFLEALSHTGIRHLTYISTYEVFESVDGVIRETHPIADTGQMTPYFQAMTNAYRFATEFAAGNGIHLTTIHPAAVYGGLNTGDGYTHYIENLVNKRFWKVPFIIAGRFPVVHADSLAAAIVKALGTPGAFIVSDQMTTLKEIALVVRRHSRSYVPVTAPRWAATLGAALMKPMARLIRRRPIIATTQIKFITKGLEPKADKAIGELGWQPMSLDEGIVKYLRDRVQQSTFV